MVEIVNRKDLSAWLEGKPREVAIAITARISLRFTAHFVRLTHLEYRERNVRDDAIIRNLDDDLFGWLRCLLTACASSVSVDNDHSAAARNAVDWIGFDSIAYPLSSYPPTYAAYTALLTCKLAQNRVDAVPSDILDIINSNDAGISRVSELLDGLEEDDIGEFESSFYEAIDRDIRLLEAGGTAPDLFETPFWPGTSHPEHKETIHEFLDFLNSSDLFAFWKRWYRGLLHGQPLSWDMQEEIALIDDEVWTAGAEAVAGEIAKIEAKYLAKATPYAERIEVNPETGKLHSIPTSLENQNLYETALDKVRDALDDLKQDGALPQHCNALAPIDKKLGRTLGRYAGNPQRVHDDFLSAAREVDRLLEVGEVANEPEVQALRTDLITGSDDIRAADGEVRASVEARVQLRIEEMRVEDTEHAADVLDDVAEVSEGALAESLAEDVETLRAIRYVTESGAPDVGPADRAETVDAVYRSAARVSRIAQGWDALKRAAEGYDTGLKIAAFGGGIVSLVGMFLRLLMGG